MDIEKDCIIHSKGGKLAQGVTSIEDAARIAWQAFSAGEKNGIVLHFHGGLVNYEHAMATAQRLGPLYTESSTYPIFSVWEAGFLETIRNNLKDILQDSVFRELLKKVSEWILKEGTSAIVTKGSGQAINVAQVRSDFDRYLNGEIAEPPLKEQSPPKGQATKGAIPDEADLAAKIESEIELDKDFEATMAGLFVASQRVSEATTRGAAIEPREVEVLIDKDALDEMFPVNAKGTTKGGIPWWSIAKFVAKVVIKCIGRFANKRDHGAYTTVVEEVLRAAYLAKIGEVIWRQMKKDTGDAFGADDRAGEVLLKTWAEMLKQGAAAPRITLVGHSTGALYINNWIRRSAAVAPSLKYDVVMLAPACRCEDFAEVLGSHLGAISNFRVFGMKDAVEQQDRLVPIVYPRSLLYFVCGVVEGDVDMPLVGMDRFLSDTEVFDAGTFKEVQVVRNYLAGGKRGVWSIVDGGPGLRSASASHGDFDDDEQTLQSLRSILTEGY